MSEYFQSIHEHAKSFFELCENGDGLRTLTEIASRHERQSFSICFVGGFSKGKTHLINQLLATDTFPEAVSPTTTLLTKISHGPQAMFAWSGDSVSGEKPLTHADMQEFSAEGSRADASGRLDVRLPAPLLESSVCFYDTPGVDDVLAHRAQVTFKALETCDAAVVAVSAVAPLSLSERAFIDTYLCKRAVPMLAIALTFLDLVPPEQRARQVAYVVDKVRELYPNVEVWCTQDLQVEGVERACQCVGIPAIQKRLRDWSVNPGLHKLRDKRDAMRLKAVVEGIHAQHKAMLNNLQGDMDARRNAIANACRGLDSENDVWYDLRSAFMDDGQATVEQLKRGIDALSRKLAADIRREEPEQFNVTLRTDLQEAAHDLVATMRDKLQGDVQKLEQAIQKRFGVEPLDASYVLAVGAPEMPEDIHEQNPFEGILGPLFDLAENLVEKGADVLPIPKAFHPTVKEVARQLLHLVKGALTESPAQRRRRLDDVVTRFCAGLERELHVALKAAYEEVAENIREKHRSWLEEQHQALYEAQDMAAKEKAIASLSQKIVDGTTLIQELTVIVEE